MSQLYIIYQNKTAGVYLEGNPYLKRYINMDTGKISFTTGTRVGGRPINPEGPLGRFLIKTADEWIKNPDTRWHDKVVWRGLFHRKYPPFKYWG